MCSICRGARERRWYGSRCAPEWKRACAGRKGRRAPANPAGRTVGRGTGSAKQVREGQREAERYGSAKQVREGPGDIVTGPFPYLLRRSVALQGAESDLAL